jgi:hypothetical protein
MNCNFYKIEKESFIDDIIEKNPYKLFVLIFSLASNYNTHILNNTFLIKKNIKNNFSNDSNTIFLFINLQKYTIKDNKYSQFITKESIPYISFFFNGKHLARILSAEYDVFETTYNKIKNELSEHFELAKKQIKSESVIQQEPLNNEKEEKHEKHDNMENLTDQIRQQRKLEEIEKLKQQYLINELTKLKRAKEIQEKLEN